MSGWEIKIELRRHILMGKNGYTRHIRHGPERKGQIENTLGDNFFKQICLILWIYRGVCKRYLWK